MAAQQKSALNVVLGCGTFGEEGKDGTRVHGKEVVGAILDIFQAHGHREIDTARMYCEGTSELVLGQLNWKERGLAMETKLYPNVGNPHLQSPGGAIISHKPEDLRKFLDVSLQALNTDSIDLFYLHAPDRTTPWAVTLKAVDELYREGKFKRFGVSNFASWEVAEVVAICEFNGYVKPSVYQGVYNPVHRNVEPELLPCLRKHGISFYIYNPLGGGFFTGRYRSMNAGTEPGSRFDPSKGMGQIYRRRYWNEHYFKALDTVEEVASKHGLTLAEVALRWLSHHSQLKREHGDSVIIGASSLKHVEQNLTDLEKGPLPEDVVQALEEAWLSVKSYSTNYWH